LVREPEDGRLELVLWDGRWECDDAGGRCDDENGLDGGRGAVSVYEVPLMALSGEPLDPSLLRGRTALIVNVATHCGLTPQYEGLQRLYERYRERGLLVLGAPCNQFASQEPGSSEEIAEFCAESYAVTFALTEKLDVNGNKRHPLYALLTAIPDGKGVCGDVQWNFEKFVVSPRGEPVARFRPTTPPEDEELTAVIEGLLPGRPSPIWSTKPATEIRPGDRVIAPGGAELTVSRIEHPFLDRDELICLIEDTPARWLAQPVQTIAEVQVLS
jgi:glutathione peroxidase